MSGKNRDTGTPWTDPDDAPELTDAWFAQAELYKGSVPARRNVGGRPKAEAPKRHVSLRLDPEVIEHFQASGPGWQTRINEALRHVVGLPRHK